MQHNFLIPNLITTITNFLTFKISGVSELGPLEEKAATRGAGRDPRTVFAGKMSDLALLKPQMSELQFANITGKCQFELRCQISELHLV